MNQNAVIKKAHVVFRKHIDLLGGAMPIIKFTNDNILRPRRKSMPPPTYAQVELTTRCNFKCIPCARESMRERLDLSVTPAKFENMLNQIPSIRRIFFQGFGEIFLAPDLQQIIDIAKARDIEITTVTNGSMLNIEKYANMALQFNALTISFDGAEKETFERIRVGGNFDKIKEGIININRMRKEQGKTIYLVINFVATHMNYTEIPKLSDLCLETGVDAVGIRDVINYHTPGEPEYEESDKFIQATRKISKELEANVGILREKLKDSHKKVLYAPTQDEKLKTTCRWPFDKFLITVEGDVTPCCLRENPKVVSFGNIYEKSFAEIWNSEAYQSFRDTMIKDTPNLICDNCPL